MCVHGWMDDGFEQGKITAQGKLLLQDILLVMEQTTARSRGERQAFRERRVFLFEQEIIFSEEMDKKKNNMSHPGYIFKNSMKVGIQRFELFLCRWRYIN